MTDYIDIGWLTLAMYFSFENAIARCEPSEYAYGQIHWHSGGHIDGADDTTHRAE